MLCKIGELGNKRYSEWEFGDCPASSADFTARPELDPNYWPRKQNEGRSNLSVRQGAAIHRSSRLYPRLTIPGTR